MLPPHSVAIERRPSLQLYSGRQRILLHYVLPFIVLLIFWSGCPWISIDSTISQDFADSTSISKDLSYTGSNNNNLKKTTAEATYNSSFRPWTHIEPLRSQQDLYIPPNLPVRTLTVLIGNLRCGELAWKSLYENVIDWNNQNTHNSSTPHVVDLALAIGDEVDPMYQNASLFGKARYVFTFPEYGDDWSQALNMIDPGWKARVAPLLSNSSIVLGGVRYGNWHGSGAISFWIRWVLSGKLIEHDLLSKYDRFVITRTDHFYMCPHDLSRLDLRYLWVPFGQDFGGITDRHLVVSSQHVLEALNILPGLFQNPFLYPSLRLDSYNPEQLLLDRWKQEGLAENVRRFSRLMFTCGNPIADDTTRWKATGDIVAEGVRKKYRKEYMQSEDTCKADKLR